MVFSLTSTPPSVGFHASCPSQKTLKHLKNSSSLDHNVHPQNRSKALLEEEMVTERDKWKTQIPSPSLKEGVAHMAYWQYINNG